MLDEKQKIDMLAINL